MRKGRKLSPESKLRIRFVLLAELSVIVLMGAILVATIIVSNKYVDDGADEQISYIHQNPAYFFPGQEEQGGGGTPAESQSGDPVWPNPGEGGKGSVPEAPDSGEQPPENPEGGGFFPPPFDDGTTPTRDTLASLRFFTVLEMSDGTISAKVDYNYDYTSDTAKEIGTKVISSGSTSGYVGEYRYNVFYEFDNKLVIFLLWSEHLGPARMYIVHIAVGMGAGSVIALIAIFFISKLAIKPVEDANKKQRRFISDASHELKTPLTIISANNEIIEMIYGEGEETKTINKQVRKMTSMVKSLTTLAKLGEISKSEFTKVPLSEVYLDVVEEFAKTFEHEGKKLNSSINEGIVISGTEVELRKLLSIMLDNANKYGKTYASVLLYKKGGDIILRCANDTDGTMEPGQRKEVFERFYRSSDARGSKVEGSGIGLSIAKEIVDIHRGNIEAKVTPEGEFIIQATFKA